MKFLITGHAGWIGSHVWNYAFENHEVVGYDLKFDEDLCETNEGSDTHIRRVLGVMKPDFIINCAGEVGEMVSINSPVKYWRNNTLAAANLFEAALQTEIPVIHLSTAALNAPGQWTPYTTSKWAAEMAAVNANDRGGKIHIVRLHNPYGPGQPHEFVIPKFFYRIKAEEHVEVGRNSRDYTYIEDIAQFLVNNAPLIHDDLYEIGTGHGTTDGVLAYHVMRVVGKEVPVHFLETQATDRIARQQIVGFKWTQLDEGLEKTWEALK